MRCTKLRLKKCSLRILWRARTRWSTLWIDKSTSWERISNRKILNKRLSFVENMKKIDRESYKTRMITSNFSMMSNMWKNKNLNWNLPWELTSRNGEAMLKLQRGSWDHAKMSLNKIKISWLLSLMSWKLCKEQRLWSHLICHSSTVSTHQSTISSKSQSKKWFS